MGPWPVSGDRRLEDLEDDAVSPTGRFRIYMGAVAGVGKTFAMLDEGWRRHRRGADVVVGFVETHGRPRTAELIRDLEVVPRKVVSYRERSFEEMDLDAVLARTPEVALVDELAHTNVPGSGRHEKRWQDVIELLDAGINVITTVNVQHLESIADAVERMTGTRVRERVPDWVVRQGRPAGAHRLLARTAATADDARQHLPAGEGPRRPDPLLPHRESGGLAGTGSALRGRRDRRGAPRLSPRSPSDEMWDTTREDHGGRHRAPRAPTP